MKTIKDALLEVEGETEDSVQAIMDKLDAQGFNCDREMAGGAFLGLTETALYGLIGLNGRQGASIIAAQKLLAGGSFLPRSRFPNLHGPLSPAPPASACSPDDRASLMDEWRLSRASMRPSLCSSVAWVLSLVMP